MHIALLVFLEQHGSIIDALQTIAAESKDRQESRAVAMKPRVAATVLSGLKFADNIHYKFKSI